MAIKRMLKQEEINLQIFLASSFVLMICILNKRETKQLRFGDQFLIPRTRIRHFRQIINLVWVIHLFGDIRAFYEFSLPIKLITYSQFHGTKHDISTFTTS